MAENYIIINIGQAGGGQVVRTENVVQRTDTTQANEFRFYWNCDTLQAIPAQGYVFDHWEGTWRTDYYDAIVDPSGQSPLLWQDSGVIQNLARIGAQLQITIQESSLYPDIWGSSSPGWAEADTHTTSSQPLYYRPWFRTYWNITAVFIEVQPQYTHLPVYNPANNTLMRHTGPNKLLRDSP